MKDVTIFPIGITESCRYASRFLKQFGYALTDHISPDITHVLLDIPSFDESGNLKDGSDLQKLLRMLPESVAIIGGNLNQEYLVRYRKADLLKDAYFQAKNAAITAECALQIAANYLHTTFSDSPALILGWGRIGKCLSRLLRILGCAVTVAARKEPDRAMLTALGYKALDFPQTLSNYRVLFNTVPRQTVAAGILNRQNCLIKLDLASVPGMVCDDVIIARGLPGKYAPESAGKLIAESIHHALKEGSI